MKIVKIPADPSREDAVRMTRREKMSMILLCHAAGALEDLLKDLGPRLKMVEGGAERLKEAAEATDWVLAELRRTLPMNQRMNLQNTAADYEMRLSPKATPWKTTVVMQKEEFRDLVDAARAKCVDCSETDETCEACKLFQLLTVVLPMDDYSNGLLCPYNLREWAN